MAQRIQAFLRATSATFGRQCATSAVLFATGDAIAQQVVERRGDKHDFTRMARMSLYGGAIFSPMMYVWLGGVLERVPVRGRYAAAFTKMALDQTVAASTVTAVFLSSMTAMRGGGRAEIEDELRSVRVTVLTEMSINMLFVPPMYRLLFVYVAADEQHGAPPKEIPE